MESCTLYCKIKPSGLDTLAKRLSAIPNHAKELLIDEVEHSVECYAKTGTVKLTLLWFKEPGDQFSKLTGNTYVYFESKADMESDGRNKVLAHIRCTEAAIGIVAEPSFESVASLEAILMFIATEYEALIFNGQEMLDSLGEVVG